jgi:phenylacetate-coenzyme A ligase PaaK-like adenylate-forming protein
MRVIGVGAPSPLFKSRRIFARLQAASSEPSPDLSVVTPLDELVAELNRARPDVIVGYPSVVAQLASEQLAGRLEISPRAVGCGSEVLTDDHIGRIEAAWEVTPGNAYVSTEVCPIAFSCPSKVGLHVCEDVCVIEVVDEAGDAVPDGTPGSRVLATNLVNRVQPLIRYEITDTVTMAAGPNPTGMPWRRIARVDGRSSEILRLPGRDGEVRVHPHSLRAPFATLEEVTQYQFEYDGERLAVAFVPGSHAGAGLVERVRSAITSALEDAGVDGVGVDARAVGAIAREPGGAAKTKQLKLSGSAAKRAP